VGQCDLRLWNWQNISQGSEGLRRVSGGTVPIAERRGRGGRLVSAVTCPHCGHRIACLQCDNGICEMCSADLWADEAIPFADIPEGVEREKGGEEA